MVKKNKNVLTYITIIISWMIFFMATLNHAEIYYYKDKNGTINFTNSPDTKNSYYEFRAGTRTGNKTKASKSPNRIFSLKVHPFQVNKDWYINEIFESSSLISSVSFSPDGKYIASGNDDNTIKLWRLKDGKLISIFKGHSDCVKSVSFSPVGRYIVSGSSDNTIKLWDVKNQALITTIEDYSCYVVSVSLSPDGRYIASGNSDKAINLWNAKDGTLIRIFNKEHLHWISSLSFSPNGFIASGSYDNSIKLWNVKDGTLFRTFNGHSDYVYSVNFSPDGRYIASGSRDHTIKLWDVENNTLIRTFLGHSDYVYSVSFSPDGSHIASGSKDHTIKLWDVRNGSLIRTFKGHSHYVSSVRFSPDSRRIASGSLDSSLRIWNINNEKDYYVYLALPGNEWISFKFGQPYYSSSPKGDKFATININNKYEPLTKYRHQYKKTNIVTTTTPITRETHVKKEPVALPAPSIKTNTEIRKVQVKLLCTFEGKQSNAYDIDEDIKVFSNCSNKHISFKYNETLQKFTGPPECPNFNVHTYKFQRQSSYPSTQRIIEMKLNKPILYVLINPSLDLKRGPLNRHDRNFDKMKNQLRTLSSKLDNNQKYRFWSNRWLRTYFYTKYAAHEPVLLNNAGIFATKWDDPSFISTYNNKLYFKNQSITGCKLIDDACHFFNGFSISDDLSIKGAALIIIASPQSSVISKSELSIVDQQLNQNKYCALIVQFGENKKYFTFKGKLKSLKLIEMNLENEFYNGFFKSAFEKIITEFESLIEENNYATN